MALFDPDGSRPGAFPFDNEPVRIRPPRRVIIGWVFLGVAFVLALVLALSPAPYVIEEPGPVFNTLGTDQVVGGSRQSDAQTLITIPGKKTYPTAGSLDMLTVSVVGNPESRPSWLDVASAYFDRSKAVVPIQVEFPPGLTNSENNAQNAAEMTASQRDAVAAALRELGYSFPQRVTVEQVLPKSPASGVLRSGDEILSVDGTAVAGVQQLRDAISKNGAGTAARIVVQNHGVSRDVSITPTTDAGQTIIGIGAAMTYSFPFTVKIKLDDVGGPSAGQMFALGIIDKLTPGYLNGGARVAGTGTIDNLGNIGVIGGIRQKMYGARAAGATWFLAPQGNCDEVTGHIPAGLHVIAVTTLKQSLAALSAIRTHHGTSSLPGCPAG